MLKCFARVPVHGGLPRSSSRPTGWSRTLSPKLSLTRLEVDRALVLLLDDRVRER